MIWCVTLSCRQQIRRLPLAVGMAALVAACATPTHFHWGDYEPVLFRFYESEEGISHQEQIELLLNDIDKAQSEGKKIAPGINLHLAMLYADMGDMASAKRFVEIERELYPMSGQFSEKVFAKVLAWEG